MPETATAAEHSAVSRANALKTLAYILGVVALVGSALIGGSYLRASIGAAKAQNDGTKFAQEAADAQFTATMQRRTDEAEEGLDEERIRGDNLDIETAELQGRSAAKAISRREADQMALAALQSILRLDQMMDSMGGDPKVAAAEERGQACEASLAVWSANKQRDEHLGYALLGLWVAFGFAWALSRPR